MTLSVTENEYKDVLNRAEEAIAELNSNLSNVSVTVPKESTEIITAIKLIFGSSAINTDGSAIITYSMFNKVVANLRQMGSLKVGEYL